MPKAQGKRDLNKVAIRGDIMSAAEEVFIEKGFRLAKMDEIAERSSITKRTLYKQYPSKVALIFQLFERYLRTLEMSFTDGQESQQSPISIIRQNYKALFEFTKNNEKFMRLYWMVDSNEFEGEIPETLIKRVNMLNKKIFKLNKDAVEKSIASGAMIDVDPELLVHLLSAINKGIFIHANKEKKFEIADINPDEIFKLLEIILENGLYIEGKKEHLAK
ncbi:MAG: TetR/AcrR family transcriptional regulator [Pseudomonadota bacterium]